MARKFKSFGSPLVSSDTVIEFELYGHTYRCAPALQGRKLLEFVASTSGDDFGQSAEALLDFMDTCLVGDDRAKFRELTTSDDQIVSMSILTDITSFLVESYSGEIGEAGTGKSVPEQSKDSSPGPMSTPSSSEAVQLPMESTSQNYQPQT
jgi:hypothetical protein